jgi:tripartite-type tricarboxylate transporter receptor subunit TctC
MSQAYRIAGCWAAAVMLCGLSASLSAQSLTKDYPNKRIRIVVPFAAGGVQDIIARAIAPALGAQLGRTVIVENRTGAGGTIGNAAVAKAAPDGNTLLLAAASHTITGHVYARLPYHPINDFAGAAHIGSVEYVLMINAAVPAKNVSEFIEFAKANPGKLNYASAGSGSATHLSMAYFASLAGVEMVHIPVKATGEAVNEVLAGRAHAAMPSNISALSFTKEARVRLLAVTGAKRSKFLPGLPTVAEALPGYEFDSWIGLLAPAATPKAQVEQINAAMAKLLQDPAMLERLDKQGVVPRALSPEQFAVLLRADFAKMEKVVKAAGARID